MLVRSLELWDFRNYIRAGVEFSPGTNLVAGENGQGKTNLLEAIHLTSAWGSHRTHGLEPLVRSGAEAAVVRAEGTRRAGPLRVDIEVRRQGGLRVLVNGAALPRLRGARGLTSVLFSPEDLTIVKGGPEERRRFLDHLAAGASPVWAVERAEFDRVLKQRNGLLRACQANPRARASIDVWDAQFASAGAAVACARLDITGRLSPLARSRHGQLARDEKEEVVLRYEAPWAPEATPDTPPKELEAALAGALRDARQRDIERGATSAGPHRDELYVGIGERDARAYASQGEQRTLALVLRLAERDVLTESIGETPVLLLDDVFSELDELRSRCLLDLMEEAEQSVVTATSASTFERGLARRLWVSAGTVGERG